MTDRLNAVRRGSGPPLLLVHGIGHRWQAWEPLLDRLAEHHEVIAVDLPGFGRSPVPARGMPPNMAGITRRLVRFVAAEGLDRPHVAGYSLGGAISLELASAGAVASATAFCPAGFFTAYERQRALLILYALRAGTFAPQPMLRSVLANPRLRALSYWPLLAHPDRVRETQAVQDALAMRNGRGFRPVARASRGYRFTPTGRGSTGSTAPRVPITVCWGGKDRILPPIQAVRARQCLPTARHVSIVDAGHMPLWDAPDRVVELILQTTGAVKRAEASRQGRTAGPGHEGHPARDERGHRLAS